MAFWTVKVTKVKLYGISTDNFIFYIRKFGFNFDLKISGFVPGNTPGSITVVCTGIIFFI